MAERDKRNYWLRVLVILIAIFGAGIGSKFLPNIWLLAIPIITCLIFVFYFSYRTGTLGKFKSSEITDSVLSRNAKQNIATALVVQFFLTFLPLMELAFRMFKQ